MENSFFGISPSDQPNLLVLGIPWDKSSSYRKGARHGPKAIRNATTNELYNSFSENVVDLSSIFKIKDLGDIDTNNVEYLELVDKISSTLNTHYKQGRVFLFLGGDHSITYASVKALQEASTADFGVVYFDAHPDLYQTYNGNRYSHACVVKRLIEENIVLGTHVIQVGIRAPTTEQVRFATRNDVTMVQMKDITNDILADLDFDNLYLSFDMDVLDPAYAPGVGNPEPGGLSTRELVEVIRQIEGDIIGFDIVETSPSYDYKGITAFAAAKILRETLGKIASNI